MKKGLLILSFLILISSLEGRARWNKSEIDIIYHNQKKLVQTDVPRERFEPSKIQTPPPIIPESVIEPEPVPIPPPEPPPPPPITMNNDSYRLKIGDVLSIAIYGEDNTKREVTIDPRGMISYLIVDSIPAVGRTISEVREELEAKLKETFRFVLLSITPIGFQGEYYTIVGEVNGPGIRPITGGSTVLNAIAESGGFTLNEFRDQVIDFSDLDKSFLSRNGDYYPCDFRRLIEQGDLSQDVPLKAGDYVYIHSRIVSQVYILGEVFIPNVYDYMDTVTLSEAISESGGLTFEASSRVVVIRGSLACPVKYLIDINRILKGCANDFELQPGDIVYVPPRRFAHLKRIFEDAVRSFVAVSSSRAGTNAFIKTHPHAKGDTLGPVPTIGGPFTTGAAVE